VGSSPTRRIRLRPDVERTIVAALAEFGDLNACRLARTTGIPRSTIREWLNPKRPPRRRRGINLDLLPEPSRAERRDPRLVHRAEGLRGVTPR
jgi:hypothetical protein